MRYEVRMEYPDLAKGSVDAHVRSMCKNIDFVFNPVLS
jgi:hypothetical protein